MSTADQTDITKSKFYKIGYHKGIARALVMEYTKSCAKIYAEGYADAYANGCLKRDPVYKYVGDPERCAEVGAWHYEKGFYRSYHSYVEKGIRTVEDAAEHLNMTVAEYQAKIAEMKKREEEGRFF